MTLIRDVFSKASLAGAAADLDAPGARQRAEAYMFLYDHGFIRTFWTNLHEISPGVFRSNQPSKRRFQTYADQGIRSVLNLRGAMPEFAERLEVEACRAAGLALVTLPGLSARRAPERDVLLDLVKTFRTIERPFLFHCKSGADRTSLAAAIYKLAIDDADIATARAQLSIRYIHFRWTSAGVVDHVINFYAAAQAKTGIDFETWLRTEYDATRVQASFDAGRR